MYDENRWNDLLHLFNGKALEISARMVGRHIGTDEARYGADGYSNFLPENSEYDLQKVRRKLYGRDGDRTIPEFDPKSVDVVDAMAMEFPAHKRIIDLIDKLSDGTRVILLFVPYHVTQIRKRDEGRTARRLRACKIAITERTAKLGNIHVLDFMFVSDITIKDQNYWDAQHYRVEVAERIVTATRDAILFDRLDPAIVRRLRPQTAR